MKNLSYTFENLSQLRAAVATQEDCMKFLTFVRWNNEPRCPNGCKAKIYKLKAKYQYKCSHFTCITPHFNVLTGTFFQNTKLPLPDWFIIIEEFCTGGLNANKISKKHDMNYRTVWACCHKLRNAMKFLNDGFLNGTVEADEFIFGSKREDNLRMSERMTHHNAKQKRLAEEDENHVIKPYGNQRVILNAITRGGRKIVKLIGVSKKDITTENLRRILKEHIPKNATLYLDSHPTHLKLTDIVEGEINFLTHTIKEPVLDENGEPVLNKNGKPKMKCRKNFKNKEGHDTNSVENSNTHLNAFLKRYRKHSYKYAQLYYDEHVFQDFHRETCFLEKIREILWNSSNTKITFEDLLKTKNPYPERVWKVKRIRYGLSHCRKKKRRVVEFVFSNYLDTWRSCAK